MRIKVKPIGLVKNYLSERDMKVLPGCTSRSIIKDLGIPDDLRMVTFINGKKAKLDDELKENDEIRLVTLVTGG